MSSKIISLSILFHLQIYQTQKEPNIKQITIKNLELIPIFVLILSPAVSETLSSYLTLHFTRCLVT